MKGEASADQLVNGCRAHTEKDRGHSTYRLVIESPGRCHASLVHSLTRISARPQGEVARCFYQAPGELLRGLDYASAEKLESTLNHAGAQARVMKDTDAFEPGVGEWEIALVVNELDVIGSVFKEVVELLRIEPQQAVHLLCQSPAVVMGNLSRVSAESLRDRFTDLGAEVDLSRPHLARYDLYLDPAGDSSRRQIEGLLRDTDGELVTADRQSESLPGLLVAGLSWLDLEKRKSELMRHAAGLKILNRDFARYDVILQHAGESSEALSAYLVRELKIPEQVVPRMLQALPVVVAGSVTAPEMEERLQALAATGATATARLVSWQTFALEIRSVPDRQPVEDVLKLLGGMDRKDIRARMDGRPPYRLEGPFTSLHARWLRRDLQRVGAEVDIQRRQP